MAPPPWRGGVVEGSGGDEEGSTLSTIQPVRCATLDDAGPIAAVAVEVFVATYLRHGVSEVLAAHVLAEHSAEAIRARLRSPPELLWVSENRDGIDGFVRLTLDAAPPCEGCSTFEVATLYVQPRHQGTGKGSALLGACLAEVGRRGGASAWLTANAENEAARAFYQRHGFAEVGRADFVVAGQAYENRVLRVDVPPLQLGPEHT